ncbi:hypothetical protein [Amycolatopsis sulphurea]
MRRGELLRRTNASRVHLVLGEAATRRTVGGAEVLDEPVREGALHGLRVREGPLHSLTSGRPGSRSGWPGLRRPRLR